MLHYPRFPMKPVGQILLPPIAPRDLAREAARLRAYEILRRHGWAKCSFQSNTVSDLIFSHESAMTAVANTISETSLIASADNIQPQFKQGIFNRKGVSFRILARGVFSVTGTPTLTFRLRLGTTAGTSTLTGTVIGITNAITTASGVSNKFWQLEADFTAEAVGVGSNNLTLAGGGLILSPTGFASPLIYPVEPSAPDTGTWTVASFNAAETYYLNFSVQWSAASASNTITCKTFKVWCDN